MSSVGYVRLYRSLLGHPAFRNDGEAMAFAWMVIRAQWQARRVRYKERIINLKRGQLAISTRDMADALDRDKAWVTRLWQRLKNETMIETVVDAGITVVTICKYGIYQADRDTDETPGETLAETGARQGRDTEQEGEKGKKVKSPPSRATSITADFAPVLTPDAQKTVDGWPPGMLERELAQFRDRAVAEGKTYRDWQAAFRTWIANAEKWRHERGNRSQHRSGQQGSWLDA